MASKKEEVMTSILSALEYLIDRGDIEHVDNVVPKVRYTSKKVERFTVTHGTSKFLITASELKVPYIPL